MDLLVVADTLYHDESKRLCSLKFDNRLLLPYDTIIGPNNLAPRASEMCFNRCFKDSSWPQYECLLGNFACRSPPASIFLAALWQVWYEC